MDTETRYKLMADAKRRAVVTALDSGGPPIALADLARQVSVYETEPTIDREREPSPHQRTYASLYHVHVPKLADAGVVSFDTDRRTVTTGPHFETVRSLVDDHREVEGVCLERS